MESLGRDAAVFRANRWFVGLTALAMCAIGALLLYPGLHDMLRTANFRRSFAVLTYLSPDVRVYLALGLAGLMIATGLAMCRHLLDPRLVKVDDGGIEVRQYFSVHRGRWRDFVGMKPIGFRGMGTIQLRFRKAQGFSTRVNLPAAPLGVDIKAVIANVAERLDNKAPPPPGSLDKYDPKKLAKKSPVAEVPIEVVMQEGPGTEAEDVQPVLETVATRRAFGKRNAA